MGSSLEANRWLGARFDRWAIAALTIICLGLCWLGNDRVSLWDRDEPRYAGTAREMLARGDFIVPYFNGAFRFQKPVLTYWLVAAAQRTLGDTEFAARWFAGFFVAAACPVVWSLGNRMFGRPAGLLAAAMLALCPLVIMLGKLCIPDGPQFFFATVCFALLYRVHGLHLPHTHDAAEGTESTIRAPAACPTTPDMNAGRVLWPALGFWLALAATVLLKGPIVAGMLAASLLIYRVLTGAPFRSFSLAWPTGLAVFGLATLPWLGAIYFAVGDAFFSESLGKQIVDRAVVAFDGRSLPPGYYAASLAIGFAPWLPLTLLALVRWRHRLRSPGPVAFLIAWVFGPMILLELFRSKQLHYYGPAYPALALLAAGYLAAVFRGEQAWDADSSGRRCAWGVGILGLVLAGVFAGLAVWGPPDGRLSASTCAAVVAVGTPLAARQLLLGRLAQGLAVQSIALGGAWVLLCGWSLPALDSQRVVRTVAEHLAREQRDTGAPIVLHQQLFEPSMVYYARRTFPDYLDDRQFVVQLRNRDRPVLTALTETDYRRLSPRLPGRLLLRATYCGWVRMHPDVVHIIEVSPAATTFANGHNRHLE